MSTQPQRSFSFMRRIFLMLFVSVPLIGSAQSEADIVDFLQAGKSDAQKLMNAYLNPMVEGLSYSFNGGWYHTAKAHNSLGFDFGVSINAVFIPSSKNYFSPADLNLQVAELTTTPVAGKAPTVIGPKAPTTYGIDWDGNGTPDGGTFNGPEGLDFKENLKVRGVVAPTAQLGIGIYKNTDLKIRWMPEVTAGSSKVKLLGFGVLHDVKQHIPGLKTLPIDLSMLVAFTNIKGETDVTGGSIGRGGDTQRQMMYYNMNAWLFQALISKKVSVITFYGGIGYNAIKTTTDLTGTYVIPGANGSSAAVKDPFSLGFKNKSLKVTAGMRFKFGPIYLNGDYSLQEYNTLSVGLGVAFR
jgi:hypothetical protein